MRKDENQIAASVVARATGEATPEDGKNPHAVAMARRRAETLGPDRRREIALRAAKTRWKGHKKK
jgi:hypothetical protein